MGILTKMRKQYAVYWGVAGKNESGQNTYQEPIELRVRWEDDDFAFIDAVGSTLASTTSVYVDRVLDIGGILWKGRLQDVPSQTDPVSMEGADEIIKFKEIPDLKAKKFLRVAVLGKEALTLIKRA